MWGWGGESSGYLKPCCQKDNLRKWQAEAQVGRIIGVKTLGQKQASLIPGRIRTSTAGGGREGSHLQIQARGLGPQDI